MGRQQCRDFYPTDKTSAYVNPAVATVARPANPAWEFLGVDDGESFLRLPAGQNPRLLYLGFGAEHATTNAFDAWNPNDPDRNVNSAEKYIQVRLESWRGPGHFSIYTVVKGVPRVWMATADGVTPSNTADSLYLTEGGHLHYNFAFTARGNYEIDISVFAKQGGQDVSTTTTLRFTTEPKLEIVKQEDNQIELKWPSLSLGFQLQQNQDLSPGGWSPVATATVDDGEFQSLVLPVVPPSSFFRLAAP